MEQRHKSKATIEFYTVHWLDAYYEADSIYFKVML